MWNDLPNDAQTVSTWPWDRFAPYYADLLARPLDSHSAPDWLADWTRIGALLDDINTRFTVATTANTADTATQTAYTTYLDTVAPQMMAAEQQVKRKLIESGVDPAGFEVPLRKLRTDAALFREANVPLLSEMRKQSLEYDGIAGAWTVTWDGEEVPLVQLYSALQEPDRPRRERAYRTMTARIIADTPRLSTLWRQMIATRRRLAANAGYDSFRAYRWQQLFRFDYTPDDAKRFHWAIEEAVVPAAMRLNEQRRQLLGLATLRPWDRDVDPRGREPLHPYLTIEELESRTQAIFQHVDPRFGAEFQIMRAEHLLDLESRKNKAPGGYSLAFAATGRPFIFMNAIGTHGDVQTLLHEGGHAFHAFASAGLPYLQQKQEQMLPMEFAEVASMGMELLASPYLTTEYGGFYTPAESARARIDNLREIITFWPYMAMIDALQHWIYEHQEEAADLERCDDEWERLVDRFWPHLDWSGLEREKRTYWHRQSHVFQDPFYYIEYGLAQLGAVQVWAHALRDQAGAVAAYRQALALGATAALPDLYAAVGAKFSFDAASLRDAVEVIEHTIAELEPVANM